MTYCSECGEYGRFERFNRFAEDNLRDIKVDVRSNLEKIMNGEVAEWLAEQGRVWRCRSCGNPSVNSLEVDRWHWYGAKY